MPDHTHADLEKWHDRMDDQTIAEHLAVAHGWARDHVTLGDLVRVHTKRHTPGREDEDDPEPRTRRG